MQVFKCWKYFGVKVWQSHFKEIIELITSIIGNSFIKQLFNFHAVVSNSDRKRYVVEEKWQQSKLKSLKSLLLNITTLVKTLQLHSVQFHLFCSVNLSYFYFFIRRFHSSILHKLKNTLNCRLKLNKDNGRSFLVNYTTIIK